MSPVHQSLLLLLTLLLVIAKSVSGIRVSSLVVPHQVGRGQDTQLHCRFELGDHLLYSVKWFKGSREFFRFSPNVARKTQAKVFPLPDLTVDVHLSNISSVFLRNVQKSNAGTYRCEISGEAPFFETDYKEANMSVLDLPQHGPIIVNVQSSYQPGEWAALNCTSAPSNPMAVLYWYIDGEFAPDPYIKRYVDGSSSNSKLKERSSSAGQHQELTSSYNGDETTATVGLEFIVNLPMRPPSGAFAIRRVTCAAVVGDIYKSETHAHLMIVDGRYRSSLSKKEVSATPSNQPPYSRLHSGTPARLEKNMCSITIICIMIVLFLNSSLMLPKAGAAATQS